MQASARSAAPPEAPARKALGLSRFEWAALAVVALAFVVRIHFVRHPEIIWDSAWYLLLGRSFAETGTFLIPWSDPPAYNGYWPPLFPVFVSFMVRLFGGTYHTLALTSVLGTALLTLAVFLTTRDLFGRKAAFAAMALVAASPAFVSTDARGMSESTLALAVTLTVWAFLKSLDNPRWLPLAGGFAVLAYLGKASLGLPIVAVLVVALLGFRLYTRGLKRTLTSWMDMGLVAAGLLGMAALAATRTHKFGGVGIGIIDPFREAPIDLRWGSIFLFKVFFAAAFLLVITLPLSLKLREALRERRWREERQLALWMAVLLPLLAGAVFTTQFYLTEHRTLVDFDNIRYLTPSIVPFIWLMLPFAGLDREPEPAPATAPGAYLRRRHNLWYSAAVGSYVVLLFLSPIAGKQTLGRLEALLALSLLPLAMAVVTRHTQFDVAMRVNARGEREVRYVEAKAPPVNWRFALPLLALGLVLAWFVSAWYVSVLVGLAIALVTPSPHARVVAMALVLLGATVPSLNTPYPAQEAALYIDEILPAGATVGVTAPIVYFAAAAPSDITMREISLPPPDGFDAIVVSHGEGFSDWPGYKRVQSWDYGFEFFPTIDMRLAIEDGLLGKPFGFAPQRGITVYVRDDMTL